MEQMSPPENEQSPMTYQLNRIKTDGSGQSVLAK